MTENPYAPPRAEVADVLPGQREVAPPLWNPNAAASWSLLFTPVFGAILHMKNWQALGEPEKAAASKKWAIANLAAMVLLGVVGGLLPDAPGIDGVSRAIGFGLLIGWYYASGKAQASYVLARFGRSYPRRGWGKPLLWGLLAYLGFFVVVATLAYISLSTGGTA